MPRTLFIVIAALALTACGNKNKIQLDLSSDELATDQRIILKEGHSVVLIPENNKDLIIGVTNIDGEIVVSEVPGFGKSLSATWKDHQSWETSVIDSSTDQTIVIIDKNGDGMPDFRAEQTDSALLRYEFGTPDWIQLEQNQPTK